jgi:hypothetical protein
MITVSFALATDVNAMKGPFLAKTERKGPFIALKDVPRDVGMT